MVETSYESITVLQVVSQYVESFKGKQGHEETHRELHRFIQWCGPNKAFAEISPSEVGDYADKMGGTGTSPQAAERLKIVRTFLSYAKKKGIIEQNLAQHVRIRKTRTRSAQPQTQNARETVELTPEGHAQMLEELRRLIAERPLLAEQIQKAAADKDVRENVPLEAAREQLGMVESRIRSIEVTLENSVVMEASQRGASHAVKIGMNVCVKDSTSGREMTYKLVSASEANPLEGKISDASPIGKALIGRSEGQEVKVETPRGMTKYKIVKVSA
ncbi:MAG: transcription elongation factor GreA [Chloroflexi bacterium]|nr:transcription elongation factor GreA [Chloroflexota bacterium]